MSRNPEEVMLSVVREAAVPIGPCPLLRTSQTSGASLSNQATTAELPSALEPKPCGGPPSELMSEEKWPI